MVVGALVNYCSVIGGPPTVMGARITEAPFRMPGKTSRGGNWAVMTDKVRGWVAIEALELVAEPGVCSECHGPIDENDECRCPS
jgi:hypothetical protein